MSPGDDLRDQAPPERPPTAQAGMVDEHPPRDDLDALLRAWHEEQAAGASKVRARVLEAAVSGTSPAPEAPAILVRSRRAYGVLVAAGLMLALIPVMVRVSAPPSPQPLTRDALIAENQGAMGALRAESRVASQEMASADAPHSGRVIAGVQAASPPGAGAFKTTVGAVIDPRISEQVRAQIGLQQLPRGRQTPLSVQIIVQGVSHELAARVEQLGFMLERQDNAKKTLEGKILPEDVERLAQDPDVTRIEPREEPTP